jgi:hypothetical protein
VVSDVEDGDTLGGRSSTSMPRTIDPASVGVALQYMADGYDRFAPAPVDPKLVRAILPGKRLMAGQDCVVCHIVSGEHRIPTYEFAALDLTGVRQMSFVVGDSKSDWAGGAIEVRIGSGVGPVIGRAEVRSESAAPVTATAAAAIADTPGVNDLYLVLRASSGERKGSVALGAITFQR